MPICLAAAAFLIGSGAAWHYSRVALTLSHYDARAHLVVARRILDSLTPGWEQIGAVWLPLPHVLNMLPVQIDAWYRSGFSGVLISVLSLSAAAGALASLVLRGTGSTSGAAAAAALLVANPNVLYLQSTPMTEPLLFATTMAALALTARWIDDGAPGWPAAAGSAMVAACLTRYEAWPITAAAIALAGVVRLRRGSGVRAALGGCLRLAVFPVTAVLVFVANSRWTIGEWFVSSGFFVPENVEALGHPLAAWSQVWEGLHRLSGPALVWSGSLGALLIAAAYARSARRAPLALLLALAAAGSLPWYAYLHGHPFRIRYDVPLVAAAAGFAGAGIGLLWTRVRPVAAVLVVVACAAEAHPLDRRAPMVLEAQRDAANMAGRRAVTAYLLAHDDGRTIMMSMGSLGHYMQDLSTVGFGIRRFLHEGNGEIWKFALLDPSGMVGWVAIEEKAEGGDALYLDAQHNWRFLRGFTRVAEGGGVALYKAK